MTIIQFYILEAYPDLTWEEVLELEKEINTK
jgi:hypothetical protein